MGTIAKKRFSKLWTLLAVVILTLFSFLFEVVLDTSTIYARYDITFGAMGTVYFLVSLPVFLYLARKSEINPVNWVFSMWFGIGIFSSLAMWDRQRTAENKKMLKWSAIMFALYLIIFGVVLNPSLSF